MMALISSMVLIITSCSVESAKFISRQLTFSDPFNRSAHSTNLSWPFVPFLIGCPMRITETSPKMLKSITKMPLSSPTKNLRISSKPRRCSNRASNPSPSLRKGDCRESTTYLHLDHFRFWARIRISMRLNPTNRGWIQSTLSTSRNSPRSSRSHLDGS